MYAVSAKGGGGGTLSTQVIESVPPSEATKNLPTLILASLSFPESIILKTVSAIAKVLIL